MARPREYREVMEKKVASLVTPDQKEMFIRLGGPKWLRRTLDYEILNNPKSPLYTDKNTKQVEK